MEENLKDIIMKFFVKAIKKFFSSQESKQLFYRKSAFVSWTEFCEIIKTNEQMFVAASEVADQRNFRKCSILMQKNIFRAFQVSVACLHQLLLS